ncbi:colicin import membrane protein [Pseudoduganella lurida]|uniref:Colicin import membrane protein n=1 Tax=Pseudoduganella lurida TaxID=1036180 RepID=A0A562RPC8_9BURK|nr:cell envelope integrity protein TolA [Pseudoduganella lurida]TWI70216.1 colicin import membrane protein [Pseudoduganella lurida]
MTEASRGGPYRVPRRENGWRAFAFAVATHALLFVFLWGGINWQNTQPVAVEAEVWDLTTQQAAPPESQPEPQKTAPEPEPEPEPEPVRAPPPPPPPTPAPPEKVAPPKVDPEIALKKEREKKKEEEKRVAAEKAEEKRKQKAEDDRKLAEQKKLDEKKKREEEAKERKLAEEKAEKQKEKEEELAEKKKAEEDKKKLAAKEASKKAAEKASADKLAKQRADEMRRIMGAAGGSSGTAEKSTAPRMDSGYVAAITAKIKSNIAYSGGDAPGNPRAEFKITQLPTGEIVSVRKVKSSGIPAYDTAVENAIAKSSPLPKKKDGTVERDINAGFNLKDLP